LTSYNGQPIAQLIPLYSFADLQQENFNFLLLLAIALSCLAGALLVFLNSRLKGQNQIVKNFMRDLFRERKERARAENQLVTHRDRLSAAVEERTRDLHLSNQKLKTQIIEKKQAVSALKESEARYRSIVENSHIGIGIINDNYTLIYANEKTGQIFGRKTSDLFGMDIRHLIAFKEIMERYLNRQQGQKEPDHYQLTIFRPNGEQREIEIIARLVTSSDGKKWTITQMLDITERQKMEQELRLSEEKHRNILASIDEGYFELKPDGEIAFCNDSLARQLNTDKQDLIGKNFRNFVDDETAETLSTVFKNLKLINEPIIIGECIVNTGPEQSKVFEISGSVIRNDSRDPLGIRGVARDVTERIKGQRQRQKKEAQLNQAHKMEAVGALASGVAHDFNNVLQAISAYVELLQASSDLQKDSRDTLEKIDQVIERAAQLVRHLLSFGREDDLETKALDLNQMVLQVADILRHTLPKMVEIKTQLCPQPTIIQGEPSRLEQVIMNLGINAKDAMPDGGILTLATSLVFLDESHVALNPKAQIGNHIKLSVADTGTGMDEKTKEHLFEPFFTTKEPGQGTGLGMATVYGIVNSLGGHIVFESSPGKGATFDIYFPLMDQKTLDIPVIQQKPSQEPADASNEACILLVDDEEVILEVGKSLLEDFGYLVHTASSGETALELIKKDKTAFDAIILDLNMPGMGGHKTLTEILRINPQAKVLIASGYATDDMTQKNLAAGAAAFINKPFRMKTLLEKLNQILTQKI
jgi:PAS domain S-box-containing protein